MRDGSKQTVAGLLRKHQELLGDIQEASALLVAKQSALDAIEAAIRVFDPTITPATTQQRRGRSVDGLYRFLLDQMRRQGAITTLGAATAMVAACGMDSRDKALVTNMRKRCGDALQKMRGQGR